MAKPTLLQTLLGRPSQTYSKPPEKQYFSNKAQLLRIVSAEPVASGEDHTIPHDERTTFLRTTNDDHNDTAVSLLPPPSIVVQSDDDSEDTDSDDIFYTPNSSPRVSMVSPNLPESIPSTKTWASRSSTSVESVSLDGHSLFSSDSSPSTGITTPLTSEAGDHEPLPRPKRRPSQGKYDPWAQDSQWLGVPTRHDSLRSTQTPKLTRSSSARSSPPSAKPAGNGTRAPIPRSASTRSPSVSRSSASRSHKQTPSIMMSMTALLEEDENALGSFRPINNTDALPNARPRNISASSRSSSGHARHHSLPTSTSTSYSPSIPSSGTPGYTSLTLPRAPPPAFAPSVNTSSKRLSILGNKDFVDLTKSGIAQTTMASVEVVRGLVGGGGGKSLFHRKPAPKGDVLGFTSYRVPPSSVPANGVLVQVWSVGVDSIDFRLASSESTGFVPGRSFVGRVLECGWEVKDEVARKGEWVVGLLDVRKSGALQEFIVADRHRVHRVPHPLSEGNMSPDELALLPLCGVSAYRAVRTFAVAFGTSVIPLGDGVVRRFTNDHEPGQMSRRVLVLRGHDGIGGMAVQILAKRGWRVCVHAPMLAVKDEDEYMRDIEDRVREWGGEEVVFDDGEGRGAVVRVIERLMGDGDTFDAILDTVGGKDIWEVSQKLLNGTGKGKSCGQFTTLVGDIPEKIIPSAGSHFKAGLRSLRNTHNHEGSKVGYAWVSIAQDVDWEGEDVRDSIGAVLRLAINTGVRPFVGGGDRTVPFERTPNIFSAGSFNSGSTVVVKVVS